MSAMEKTALRDVRQTTSYGTFDLPARNNDRNKSVTDMDATSGKAKRAWNALSRIWTESIKK